MTLPKYIYKLILLTKIVFANRVCKTFRKDKNVDVCMRGKWRHECVTRNITHVRTYTYLQHSEKLKLHYELYTSGSYVRYIA